MNNEIKEILDYFQKDVDKYEESKRYLMKKYGYDEETIDNISQHERHINTKKLLDYITNLQQENERLETNCGELQNAIDNIAELVDVPEGMSVEDVYDKVKDYKSRCEKAIEYIKEAIENDDYFEDDIATDISEPTYDKYVNSSSLLNILQNGSDKSD